MALRVFLFVILSFKLSAQQFSAASFLGSGGAAAAQRGVFSLQDNPSGITAVHTATVASAYQQHFGSSGVATQALFAVVPVGARYRLGFLAVNYGVRNVSSFLRGGLSFVRSFGGSLSTSISANYQQFFVQHYESQRQFTADLGFSIVLHHGSAWAFSGVISRTAVFRRWWISDWFQRSVLACSCRSRMSWISFLISGIRRPVIGNTAAD